MKMKKEHLDGLVEAAQDIATYLQNKKVAGARVDKVAPNEIAAIRQKLALSQTQFAKGLGISLDTLQNWEQGRREPTGPAKVLLRVVTKNPKLIFEAV